MRIQRTWLAIGCVISFALVGLGPLLSPGLSGLVGAQAPQAVHPSPWQALAQTVAMNLTRAGIPSPYVPALTREYLGAFQRALVLGMPAPQADMIATQHVTAVIQQALAAMGSGGSTSTYGNAGGLGYQIGSDGQGFTGAFFSDGTGVSCGPDGGCVYSK
jgi:hypothetical protein